MARGKTQTVEAKTGNKGGRPKAFTDEDIERLGNELISIISEDDSWHFVDYFAKAKVSMSWFHNTIKSYPKFSEYAEQARYILAAKHTKIAIAKGDRWFLKTYINRWTGDRPEYLKELQEEEEIRARAKAQAEMDKLEEANKRARELIEKLDANCKITEADERA